MKTNLYHLKGKNANAFNNIPEGYFENLKNEVLSRIDQKEDEKHRNVFWPRAVAAFLLILLTTASILFFTIRPCFHSDSIAELNSSIGDDTDPSYQSQSETIIAASTYESTQLNNANKVEKNSQVGENQDENALISDLAVDDIINYLIEKEELEF